RLGGARLPLSNSDKARLHRIAHRAPEVMVKITGRTRGTAGHLKAHLDYITWVFRPIVTAHSGLS
ncbi:MAG: hypothetical protein M3N23_04730, partial [Pseudomonadota bacterium]|nr:hypothetical protein [Pseudomonadota bacterium]